MLTLQKVAQRLGVHINTVRRYVGKGIIPAVKLERAWRVQEKDLEDFIKSPEARSEAMKTVGYIRVSTEEHYQKLFEQSPVGIGLATLDGKVISDKTQGELVKAKSIS